MTQELAPTDKRTGLALMAPGLLTATAAVLALRPAATLLHAPAPLLAVIAGLGISMLPGAVILRPGFDVFARAGLRWGVALMGSQISWGEIAAIGLPALFSGGAIVVVGLGAGTVLGMAVGLPLAEAAIAAGAVSICGASAALALSQVAPRNADLARTTALVIVGVNLLSTAAMLLYPPIATALGMSPRQAGVFLGLSIHDVAQVTGAGAALSTEATHAATLAKLGRIVWLGPAVLALGVILSHRKPTRTTTGRTRDLAPLPYFVWGFMALVLLRGLDLIPALLLAPLAEASSLLVLGGVFAISASIDPTALLRVPMRLVATLSFGTLLVAALGLLAAMSIVR